MCVGCGGLCLARALDLCLNAPTRARVHQVINFGFPATPKLFVHRVGRAARQGRPGVAISLVAPDELPYMIDLHLFLGLSLTDAVGVLPADAGDADERDAPPVEDAPPKFERRATVGGSTRAGARPSEYL